MIRNKLHRMRGITLIELMIVIVVLSVLVSVAVPSYREFAARATRAEAKAALLQIATNQERFYLQNSRYTQNLGDLGFADNETDTGAYIIDVPEADANNYRAVALYQRADAEAGKCSTFEIDGRGVKRSEPDNDCWTRTN